jgi:hypothetical protein
MEKKKNNVGAKFLIGPLQVNILACLPGYPNILRGELYTLLIAAEHTKTLSIYTFIFTYNLNNIYLSSTT